jgi:retron-type reverse transcriptase
MSEQDEILRLHKRLARLDDAVVLQRMKALGYWPAQEGLPPDPPPEAQERREIEAELARIAKSRITGVDVEQALRAERIRRWEESKQRRAQKKVARDAERRAQVAAWAQAKDATIVHAGVGVSDQLGDTASDPGKLAAQGLPVLHDASDLAQALGVSLSRLRWLTFHRRGATLVHYHRYGIPKKSGGIRAISAPKPALDQCQRWIFEHIVGRLPVTEYAHGFVEGRSCVTNAHAHVGRKVLLNLDLKEFFPSIRFTRVRGLFKAFGYSGMVATLLALLCTEPPRVAGAIAGDPRQRVFHVALGERGLPQGACTSPAITNLICKRLDFRLAGLARAFGFNFTRYADDLSFSGDDRSAVGRLLGAVRRVLKAEGFVEHPDKTHIMGTGRRQEVTGLTVNQAVGLKREDKRRLRAMLHNAARFGLESQNRDGHPNFANYLRGWVAYAVMVDPASAETLYPALREALK